jgi:phage terminase small subunit
MANDNDDVRDYTERGIDPESGLSNRHRLFCDHYLTTLNQRQAYTLAGYTASTPQGAETNASEIMALPGVREWIALKMQQRANALSVRADAVLLELVLVCTAHMGMYRIDPAAGVLTVVPGVAAEYVKAVKKFRPRRTETITRTPDGTVTTVTEWTCEIELYDKLRAANILCQHLGLTEAKLPPLEVLLNRLPPNVSAYIREAIKQPAGYRPPIADAKPDAE